MLEVAARQRTLAERYVKEVLLARDGARVDPNYTAAILINSAQALLDGGTAPPVNGDAVKSHPFSRGNTQLSGYATATRS